MSGTIRRFLALFFITVWLWGLSAALAETAVPDDTVNYQITSYVIYLTVRQGGDVRVREEIIYTNPSVYDGYTQTVDMSGLRGMSDIEVWVDGQAVSENVPAEGNDAYFTFAHRGDTGVIDVYAPSDSQWRTFVFAYTLEGLAQRGADTALLRRVLVPAYREALYQGTAVIVTLPRSDGEITAWFDSPNEDDKPIIQYDTVSFGPVDIGTEESLSLELLFPAEWLTDAAVSDGAPLRADVIGARQAEEEVVQQQTSTLRAQQYTITGVYVALTLLALFLLRRRYGVKKKAGLVKADQALTEQYPAALASYTRFGDAISAALSSTLCELNEQGAISLEDHNGSLSFGLHGQPDGLMEHQKKAYDLIEALEGGRAVSSLNAGSDHARAKAFEARYTAYKRAVAKDALSQGLIWGNERMLTWIGGAFILLGFMCMGMLLLVGKVLLIEAIALFAFIMIVIRQFDRVRRLTDPGEALDAAACARTGELTPCESLPLAVAMKAPSAADEEAYARWTGVTEAIRSAHIHNASLRPTSKRGA